MKLITTIMLILGLLGCAGKKVNDQKKGAEVPEKDTVTSKTVYLNDAKSVVRAFGDVMPLLNKETAVASVYFNDAEGKTWLKMLHYPGTPDNQFSYFEVGMTEEKFPHPCITSAYYGFITESGISIGCNKDSVIKARGTGFTCIDQSDTETLRYTGKSALAPGGKNAQHENGYYEEYVFRNDTLIQFCMGYDF